MGSTIVTTNRSFEDWGQLFGDKVMASAIIDRLVHHAFIIKLKEKVIELKTLKKQKTNDNFFTFRVYTFEYPPGTLLDIINRKGAGNDKFSLFVRLLRKL